MADPSPKPARVQLFATCLVEAFFPETALAAVELIEREGVEVVFPAGQTCCGQPAYNAGHRNEARAAARRQLSALAGDLPVVVPSASCAGMMKHHYPRLFSDPAEREAAERLAHRVVEFGEFLVRGLGVRLRDAGPPLRVAWHSSCHALREMGVVPFAKALLAGLARVDVVPLRRETECCGFGGIFAVKHPALSAAMAEDKLADLAATGAERLIAGDCGCLLHLRGAIEARGLPLRVQHLAEFLRERVHGG